MGWINEDIPVWIEPFDRFASVVSKIRKVLLGHD